jgi:hypothetical protein
MLLAIEDVVGCCYSPDGVENLIKMQLASLQSVTPSLTIHLGHDDRSKRSTLSAISSQKNHDRMKRGSTRFHASSGTFTITRCL